MNETASSSSGTVLESLENGLGVYLEDEPAAHDREVIERGLIDHARQSRVQERDRRALSVLVRPAEGDIVAGLNAVTVWGWLHVKELWVSEQLRGRGLGSRILLAAEAEAVRRGCHHALLDTGDFQARPFYERLGYRVWGELADFPAGHTWFYLSKALDEPRV